MYAVRNLGGVHYKSMPCWKQKVAKYWVFLSSTFPLRISSLFGSFSRLLETGDSVRTYPMIRAAAVLMNLLSPSGFSGTGVIGKVSSVRRGAVVTATIVLKLEEKKAAVREGIFLRPWVEFIRRGEILKMTPLSKSRFIQQPILDHPSCPLTATQWPRRQPVVSFHHRQNR